jgi:hypothetical protein
MRKRKLDIDHLAVESFETGNAAELRGTVRAHAQSEPYHCASGVWSCLETCDIDATCGMSCNGTCSGDTCAGSTCTCM